MLLRRHRSAEVRERKKVPEPTNTEQTYTYDNDSERPQYTKTDINRMSKAELVYLAGEVGIYGADEMNGSDLKEQLISHFNL